MTDSVVVLSSYRCTGTNPRTRRPCGAVVIDAWSATGAVVRRRCHQCGTWQTILVEASDLPELALPLTDVVLH